MIRRLVVSWRARRAEPRCPACGTRESRHPALVSNGRAAHAWPKPIVMAPAVPTEIPPEALG